MSEGEGASNKNFGPGGNRWHGQIVDDSVWRDNILAGKYEDKDTPEGWGRRYKVRIFGEHDLGGEEGKYPISDEQLPWAMIEFPVTAGSGAGNCKQTPALRQGNIVAGYWADGHNKQMPIITGVYGNNEQTPLGTEFPIPVTDSKTKLAVSAFPNKQLRKPEEVARPKPPQTALITKKPTQAGTTEPRPSPNARLDDLGLPLSVDRSPAILADIQRAHEMADARIAAGQPLDAQGIQELTKFYVHRGIKEREKYQRSSFSPASPGATTEALGEHLKTASDIGRENKFQEKIVLMKPDCVVDSATKSIQTISENLTEQIKLYTNSMTDYSAATQRPSSDFKKMIKDSACQISKYTKIIMQKVQEYTNKTMNTELTDVVAEMPSYMRAQFLDVKEENNKNLVKQFNSITDNMCGLIENILETSLDVEGLIEQVRQRELAANSFTTGAGNLNGEAIANLTSSSGSGDSTIDLSGVPQPYNSGQTYQPGAVVLHEGIRYMNRRSSVNIPPPRTDIWQRFNGIMGGGNSDEIISYQNEEQPTYTKVPVCYAEDIVGQIFSYNKASINGAVKKAVGGMNRYVEDMQSQLDAYEATFKYKAAEGDAKGVIALSDEEGLGDDRGGAGYTTQKGVPTAFRGSLGGGGQTGGNLTVDITVGKGGPAGRAPEFKDEEFVTSSIWNAVNTQATTPDDHYFWVTIRDKGSGYQLTHPDGTGGTAYESEGILFGCPTTRTAWIDEDNVEHAARTNGPDGIGATVDIYFRNQQVEAVRCALPYTGSVSDNGYSIGDVLEISPNGRSAMWGNNNETETYPDNSDDIPECTNCTGTNAKIMINRKEVPQNPEVYGRLRGPIDDGGIKIANGGFNYEVGQLIKVVQVGNPSPALGEPANNIGAPQGGAPGGDGGVDASFTVVGVLDKGDKRAGVGDPNKPAVSKGFGNMLKDIGGVLGNLTSALNFDNMPVNIFPSELPPNKALADYYTLGDAGAAAPAQGMPMMGQITEMAKNATSAIPTPSVPFALPVDPQNINLNALISARDAQQALDNTVAGWRNTAQDLIEDQYT